MDSARMEGESFPALCGGLLMRLRLLGEQGVVRSMGNAVEEAVRTEAHSIGVSGRTHVGLSFSCRVLWVCAMVLQHRLLRSSRERL